MRSIVVGDGEYPGKCTGIVPVSPVNPWTDAFTDALALQLLAYRGAVALGRDPNAWLGGVRTDLLNETSTRSIRGSRVE